MEGKRMNGSGWWRRRPVTRAKEEAGAKEAGEAEGTEEGSGEEDILGWERWRTK
jgi:hypothetical protein